MPKMKPNKKWFSAVIATGAITAGAIFYSTFYSLAAPGARSSGGRSGSSAELCRGHRRTFEESRSGQLADGAAHIRRRGL